MPFGLNDVFYTDLVIIERHGNFGQIVIHSLTKLKPPNARINAPPYATYMRGNV
jgi:hypothetical protein